MQCDADRNDLPETASDPTIAQSLQSRKDELPMPASDERGEGVGAVTGSVGRIVHDAPRSSRWLSQKMLGKVVMHTDMAVGGVLFYTLSINSRVPLWALFLIMMAFVIPSVLIGMNMQGDRQLSWGTMLTPRKVEDLSPKEKREYDDLPLVAVMFVVIIVFLVAAFLLAWIAFQGARAIPAGDQLWKAAIRVSYALAALAVAYWLFVWSNKQFRRFAARRLPPRFLQLYDGENGPSPTPTWQREMINNWHFLAAFIVCVLILCRVVDMNSKLFDVSDARKLRALFLLIQWARGNPNTVVLSAIVFGIVSLGIYVSKVWTATARARKRLTRR